ncbi:MAG: class I SAM-dependent methyltransferase, partial [Planctomycetota bacterium]
MDHESPRSSFEGEEAAGPSPVPGSWYRSSFGGEYLQVYRRRDATQARAEVAFTVRALSLRPGERVLDLCCGAGRHVDPLADAGLLVHALDLSLP